jgi:hypothetical protein
MDLRLAFICPNDSVADCRLNCPPDTHILRQGWKASAELSFFHPLPFARSKTPTDKGGAPFATRCPIAGDVIGKTRSLAHGDLCPIVRALQPQNSVYEIDVQTSDTREPDIGVCCIGSRRA